MSDHSNAIIQLREAAAALAKQGEYVLVDSYGNVHVGGSNYIFHQLTGNIWATPAPTVTTRVYSGNAEDALIKREVSNG